MRMNLLTAIRFRRTWRSRSMIATHRCGWVVRMEYKFTIKLKPITKKNSQQIVKDKTGRPRIVPSSAYRNH